MCVDQVMFDVLSPNSNKYFKKYFVFVCDYFVLVFVMYVAGIEKHGIFNAADKLTSSVPYEFYNNN